MLFICLHDGFGAAAVSWRCWILWILLLQALQMGDLLAWIYSLELLDFKSFLVVRHLNYNYNYRDDNTLPISENALSWWKNHEQE